MAISLEFINLIIPISRIDAVYPSGFWGYRKANAGSFVGDGSMWHDDHLLRDGVMNPLDMGELRHRWTELGLIAFHERDGQRSWADMCVVDTVDGPTLPCEWLVHDRQQNCVSMRGTEPGAIVGRRRSGLCFCTRCGVGLTPYEPNRSMTLRGDFGWGYGRALDVDNRETPGESSYWCPQCNSRWLSIGADDTGKTFACGHFMPVYAEYCGRCGVSTR